MLFDLDGTLWRGHEWYALVLYEVCGVDRAATRGRLAAGANVFQLAEEAGLSRLRTINACGERVESLEMYDGVVAGLQGLSERGRKLGIVTSLSPAIAGPALESLGLDQFFGVKAFAARKPHPGALLAALGELGEEAHARHYYVGDSVKDAECAARAGVAFAWASYGYGAMARVANVVLLEKFADVVDL